MPITIRKTLFGPPRCTGKDGKSVSASYDQFGNVLTSTDLRGNVTTYTYDYSNFPLGRLTQVQTGSHTPTTYTYYEPSGLVHTVTYREAGVEQRRGDGDHHLYL